jgi:hypothetical protein
MSAPFAWTAPRAGSPTYARIAVAVLSRDRSVPPGNGGRACQWPSARRRTSVYTFHIVLRISRRIRERSRTFRPRGAEHQSSW